MFNIPTLKCKSSVIFVGFKKNIYIISVLGCLFK